MTTPSVVRSRTPVMELTSAKKKLRILGEKYKHYVLLGDVLLIYVFSHFIYFS
jgi:hypothetical protein